MDYATQLAIDAAGRELEESRERDRQRELITKRGDRGGLIYKTRDVAAQPARQQQQQQQFMDAETQKLWDDWLQSHLARQGQGQQEIIDNILGALEDVIAAVSRLRDENDELRAAIKKLPGERSLDQWLHSGPRIEICAT
jgi:hypothetical protein